MNNPASLILTAAQEMGALPIAGQCRPRTRPSNRAALLSAQDAWLDRNTIQCPHLVARIRPEQCAALRKRPENGEASATGPGLSRPPQCASCTCYPGFDAKKHAAEERRRMLARKTGLGTCEACGRNHVNRVQEGVCCLCFRRYRAGKLANIDGQWVFTCPKVVTLKAAAESVLVLVAGRVRTLADLTEEELQATAQAQAKKPEPAKEKKPATAMAAPKGKTGVACGGCQRKGLVLKSGLCYHCKRMAEEGLLTNGGDGWIFQPGADLPREADPRKCRFAKMPQDCVSTSKTAKGSPKMGKIENRPQSAKRKGMPVGVKDAGKDRLAMLRDAAGARKLKAKSAPRKRVKKRLAPKTVAAIRKVYQATGAQEIPLREIAQAMGVQLGTVRSTLRRARVAVSETRLGPGLVMTDKVKRWCGLEIDKRDASGR